MRILDDGSSVMIIRKGAGYTVEHYAVSGVLANSFDCDTLGEARAAFHFGPARW